MPNLESTGLVSPLDTVPATFVGTADPAAVDTGSGETVQLRLLSYNIQTGISTSRYRHYLTQSWKHVLPHRSRKENLDGIAELIGEHDVVGLQEVDAGSLRSGFINQVDYLAGKAGMPYWYHQTNRRFGRIAQHSIGLLSRLPVLGVEEHRLPGAIPGRGLMVAHLGAGTAQVTLMILHLALGRRARMRQIHYLSELVRANRNVIVMGDLNFRSESREMRTLLGMTGLAEPKPDLHTFPSWRPRRNIDHILVSRPMRTEQAEVVERSFSDHLPIRSVVSVPTEGPART